MLKRHVMALVAILVFCASPGAQPLDKPVTRPASQTGKKPVRILIENHAAKDVGAVRTTFLADPLREKLSEYGVGVEVVDTPSQPYDVRVILTTGKGGMWCANTTTKSNLYETFFAVSAVALGPGGKTLFTAAHAAQFGPMAAKQVGADVAKNISERYQDLVK